MTSGHSGHTHSPPQLTTVYHSPGGRLTRDVSRHVTPQVTIISGLDKHSHVCLECQSLSPVSMLWFLLWIIIYM